MALNGRVYERVVACRESRPARALYHSALEVRVDGDLFVVEQTPARAGSGAGRGVVGEGPVGAAWAGRARPFRYEVRCWAGGVIPDVAEAVDSPRCVSGDHAVALRVLDVVKHVPLHTWGRDELGTGEMWNSNSVIAWILTRSGIDASAIDPPAGGRAPGWLAGCR